MPAGDPMWKCESCGAVYYTANTIVCPTCLGNNACAENIKMPPDDFFMKSPLEVTTVDSGEIGVIVGRFQTPYLHAGYKELFEYVRYRHSRVFVFLGVSPVKGTKHDPLPFQARRAMIETEYPTFEVFSIDDVFDVDKWSRNLDRQIDLMAGPGQRAVLYGSRDCTKYTGKYPLESVRDVTKISSTEVREQVGLKWQNDQKWREGVVWLSQNRFPVCYPTVDMAVVDFENDMVCLARKPHETKYRFPGGFADIHSDSYESDAIRELSEEFNIDALALDYIGSTIVDDARYRSQVDKIKTLFYAVTKWNGTPTPGDDLKGGEAKWFTFEALEKNEEALIVPTHRILWTMLRNWKTKLATVQQKVKTTKK